MADVVLRPWLIMRQLETDVEECEPTLGTLFLGYAGGQLTWVTSALKAIRFETEAELDWYVSNVQFPTWPDSTPVFAGQGYGPIRKRQVCFQGAEEAYSPAPAAPMRLLEYRHGAAGQVFRQFMPGDMVEKVKGYTFDGCVVAVFQTAAGEWRVVVEKYEHTNEKTMFTVIWSDDAKPTGLLHIFHPKQIRKIGATNVPVIEPTQTRAHGRRDHSPSVPPAGPQASASEPGAGPSLRPPS